MKNIIKIFTLLAVMLCTAGNSFAGGNYNFDLGEIIYDLNAIKGGTLEFYDNAELQTEVSFLYYYADGMNTGLITDPNVKTAKSGLFLSSWLTDNKIYIKATADVPKCLGAADADGKVSFIKVEQTISSNAAQSRTRADIDLGFVDVYATETQGVYYFQMPNDKNINVKVSVEFPDTQVSIEGWTYSEAANAPTLSAGTNTGTGVAYTYKQQDAADDTYTDAVPTQAGKYTVRAFVNGNYTTTANFTIAQKALAITAEAKTKVYSEKDPALTYQQSGLVKGDAISGALARAEGENAGEYAISLGTIAASSNYAISFTGAKFTISKKPLTITADDKTKVYGEKDPALTYQQSGLVEGDAFSGALARVEGENVGEYAINQGTLAASDNYTVSFTGAKLTITAATLTSVSATGYEGTFDGQAHTIKVTAPEGATIKYGTEEGEYNLEAAPEYTTDGTYTVYYQVSKANYTTVTGSATIKINPSAVVDENNSEQIGDEVFYQPKEEVQNAIQNTIETGVAFTGEAANKATVNEQGELEFAQGENVNIALTDQKQGDVVKLVFEGHMYGDSEKLALKNAPAASRGTRAKDDMELISGAEYEVLQSGNIVLTVAAQEAPVTLKGITSTPANTSGIRTIDCEQYAIDSWYDMNGRKLQGKPTRKGMYIHSGLKTIIK